MPWPGRPIGAGAFLACALALWGWGCAASPRHLRVLTYNIRHGEGTDGRFDLERLARVILSADPDVVAVQEVDVKTRRSQGVDQAAELGRLTGMRAVFAKAMDYAGGQYGELVLTRWPVLEVRALALPHAGEHEPRAALAVRLRQGAAPREFLFVATHLDHTRNPGDRAAQAAMIDLAVARSRVPVILAGDLNDPPTGAALSALEDQWVNTTGPENPQPTSPSHRPRQQIDHVLLSRRGPWRVVEVRVLDEPMASDHRPLLVVLEWTGH